jgi:hypothetical protein
MGKVTYRFGIYRKGVIIRSTSIDENGNITEDKHLTKKTKSLTEKGVKK